MDKKVALIGLGNILLGDEGFGVHFIRHLQEEFIFPPQVEIIDGGCAGLGLINIMRGFDVVYIFDIFKASEPPGTLRIFDWETIENLADAQLATVHQLGVKDALQIARFQGIVPEYFRAYAVVPQDLSTGIGLSETLQRVIPSVREELFNDLKQWHVHPKPKKPKPS